MKNIEVKTGNPRATATTPEQEASFILVEVFEAFNEGYGKKPDYDIDAQRTFHDFLYVSTVRHLKVPGDLDWSKPSHRDPVLATAKEHGKLAKKVSGKLTFMTIYKTLKEIKGARCTSKDIQIAGFVCDF